MSLPPGFLDEIRARVSIADVIGRTLSWDTKKSNPARGDYWACCPFHQEKTSSFHVDDKKGFYHCFGCKQSGDAIGFLRDAQNMGFMEAVEILARDAGMDMPARDPAAEKKREKQLGLTEVMEQAAAFYQMQLHSSKGLEAREYIRRRGLKEKTVERFGIGYAPDSRSALREHLAAKNISPAMMEEAGLIATPDGGGAPYDRFRGRVIFPIRDVRGRCIAFGGRALSPDARAKYLNSPETPLFDKSRVLFNAGMAREAAGRAGALVVAEGYMDVIALAEAGIEHAVAPLGTAITEDQLRLMWRIADEPVIALDGDKAGLRAAERVIDIALPLLAPGRGLRFALMPEGRDPDDLIRSEGAAAMRKRLDEALPMVELLWRRETAGGVFDSPERRSALDRRLREALGKITDQNLRGHYADALRERRAKLFGASRGERPGFRGGSGNFRGGKKTGWRGGFRDFFVRPMPSTEVKSSSLVRQQGREGEARGREAALLLCLLNHPALLESRTGALEDMEFICPDLERLRFAIISASEATDAKEDRSAWISRIEQATGENPAARLMAIPQARDSYFASPASGATESARGFDEALGLHRAVLARMREVAEAESGLNSDAGQEVDQRLQEAANRLFSEANQGVPDSDQGEEQFRERLEKAFNSKIWVKSGKRRS